MSDTTTAAHRDLWRIAELGSRCSDPSWQNDRRPVWASLEAVIAEVEAQFTAAATETGAARARAARAESRVKAARREVDGERTKAAQAWADAEAARRERDRERAKAEKATAEAAASRRERDAEKARAAEAVGAAEQAADLVAAMQTQLEEAETARHGAEEALGALRQQCAELQAALDARAGVEAERDALRAQLDTLEAEREAAEEMLTPPAAPADGPPVVVMARGWVMAGPAAEAAAAQPAQNAEGAAGAEPVLCLDHADELLLDDASEQLAATTRRLSVRATLGNLLPDDLGPLLVPGAVVLRREGRLAAVIAVPVPADAWSPSNGGDAEQVRLLLDEGFRVEWADEVSLAS